MKRRGRRRGRRRGKTRKGSASQNHEWYRRRVDDEIVHLTPVHVTEELLDKPILAGAAPNHGIVLRVCVCLCVCIYVREIDCN